MDRVCCVPLSLLELKSLSIFLKIAFPSSSELLMINHEKLELVANAYCDHFDSWWEHEEHKLKALKQFKEHWDLGCEDFVAMYQLSTQYADQLLIADKGFPGGMIVCFAKMAEHTTKQAFFELLDESKDLASRIDAFTNTIRILLNQFAVDNPNWALNIKQSQSISSYLYFAYPERYYVYQKDFTNTIRILLNQFAVDNPNWALNIKQSQSISSYLYFAYPERYYVYQKELVAKFASFLDCPLKLADSLKGGDLVAIFEFFDQVKDYIKNHHELLNKGQALFDSHGLKISALNLMVWDFSCFYARSYDQR